VKVALVMPAYAADGINLLGGGERYAYQLARALRAHADVTLVTFGPRFQRREQDGLRHVILPSWAPSRENPIPMTSFFWRERFDLIHAFQLRSASTSVLALWCRARGTPLVVTDVGGGGRSLMFRLRLYRLIPHFICISDFSRGLIPQEVRSRASVVLGGIDLERYGYQPGPRRRQALLVARIMPHKGIDTLIAAAGSDIPVVVAGAVADPRYLRDLEAVARGTQVQFAIRPDDDSLLRLYRESAVTVSASVYRDLYGRLWPQSELLGLTLLESMAVGTPVICTRVGGMPEYVLEGVTGFIVPPNDPPALRERLLQLLDDAELTARMGEAARRHVQAFSWSAVADAVAATYQRIVAAPRSLDPTTR
jgi:glycosyltransferase involved in cell wall biosynthesis